MKEGYIPQKDRKKILLLADDVRFFSGIATIARELVIGTCHQLNWVNLGAGIKHPENGKRLDISQDTGKIAGIEDASTFIYPNDGYGNPELVRYLIDQEKPDAIVMFTDPRYWTWLFQMENEIRKQIPICYISIWDSTPAPLYNKSFYESCDALLCISKQTENLTKLILGDKAKDRVIQYFPHGINETIFFPINEYMTDQSEKLSQKRTELFGDDQPEFVIFFNSRNIRRKCVSDLISAYAVFCDSIGTEKAKKCRLLLHTDPIDENGTDLPKVIELLCDPSYQKVTFTPGKASSYDINLYYNLSDVVCLISSNEGWGLSLTEAMMCGKMIIANTTGGMQDQMRFTDESGNWIEFDENFPSNHYGTYKECGEWAVPVFPSNLSLVGSVPTPYIWDDRCDFRDVAKAIEQVYSLTPQEREKRGLAGREWVQSDESNMSARRMSKTFFSTIDKTISSFKKRSRFELVKVEQLLTKKLVHKLIY
jgi:glycosyltransferase involved in cell wall biosynthesis